MYYLSLCGCEGDFIGASLHGLQFIYFDSVEETLLVAALQAVDAVR